MLKYIGYALMAFAVIWQFYLDFMTFGLSALGAFLAYPFQFAGACICLFVGLYLVCKR